MHFATVELLRYGVGIALEAGVCGLALHRGLYGRFRLFTLYLCALVPCEIIRWAPILAHGERSASAFWAYWITECILILLRGAVVFEIFHHVLQSYPGVWRFCRGILVLVGSVVVITAFNTAEARGPYAVRVALTADRGFELAIIGVMLFALIICRYYRIPVERLSGMLAFGIGLYSTLQVANNTFLNHWLLAYIPYWKEVRLDSFLFALLIWVAALRRPLPALQPEPELLDPRVYSELAPEVSVRLRELNAKLEELKK
ncbi:MAG: hypothetical protein WBP79_04475 [Candidatus Acidiferrales bacterium]